jgi:hypothetical protein
MNSISSLFQQAQLAEAAYADFIDSSENILTNDNDVIAALTATENRGQNTVFANIDHHKRRSSLIT